MSSDPTIHPYYPKPEKADNLFLLRPDKKDSDYYCQGLIKLARGEHAGKWTYCMRRAGDGTNHIGYGRCKHHGGALPVVENRYASLLNPTYNEVLQSFYNDPDPLNLRSELAIARTILTDVMNKHEEWNEALMAWWASFDPNRRGLHDMPLYHAQAMKLAVDRGYVTEGMTSGAFQEGLERGLADYQAEWLDANEGGAELLVLRVDRPKKAYVDVGTALKALTEIRNIAKLISELESKAYLSIFSFEQLLERYAETIFEVIQRRLTRNGTDAGVAIEIFNDIAERWEAIPLTDSKSSVPRLEAQSRKIGGERAQGEGVRPEASS